MVRLRFDVKGEKGQKKDGNFFVPKVDSLAEGDYGIVTTYKIRGVRNMVSWTSTPSSGETRIKVW